MNTHAKIALDDDHLAAGDDAVVHNNVHWLRNGAIQFDDGPGGQLDHVPEEQLRASERNADRQLDIEQQIDGTRLLRWSGGGWWVVRNLHSARRGGRLVGAGRRGLFDRLAEARRNSRPER